MVRKVVKRDRQKQVEPEILIRQPRTSTQSYIENDNSTAAIFGHETKQMNNQSVIVARYSKHTQSPFKSIQNQRAYAFCYWLWLDYWNHSSRIQYLSVRQTPVHNIINTILGRVSHRLKEYETSTK